jgi:hypothetical protein
MPTGTTCRPAYPLGVRAERDACGAGPQRGDRGSVRRDPLGEDRERVPVGQGRPAGREHGLVRRRPGGTGGADVRRPPDRDGLGEPQQLPQQRDPEEEVADEEPWVPFERVQEHDRVGEGPEVARDPQLGAARGDGGGPHHLDGPEQPDGRELGHLLDEPGPGGTGPPLVERRAPRGRPRPPGPPAAAASSRRAGRRRRGRARSRPPTAPAGAGRGRSGGPGRPPRPRAPPRTTDRRGRRRATSPGGAVPVGQHVDPVGPRRRGDRPEDVPHPVPLPPRAGLARRRVGPPEEVAGEADPERRERGADPAATLGSGGRGSVTLPRRPRSNSPSAAAVTRTLVDGADAVGSMARWIPAGRVASPHRLNAERRPQPRTVASCSAGRAASSAASETSWSQWDPAPPRPW